MKRGCLFAGFLLLGGLSLAQEHGGTANAEHTGAAEGHGGKEEPSIIWKWANFAILAGGLGYLGAKAGPAFFRSRTEEIQKGIREASKMKADAEARAAEMDRKLAHLEAEIAEIRSTAKQEIAAEGERVGKETAQQLVKIREHGEQEIASAAKHARQELKAYSAELAIQLAEKKIEAALTPQREATLIDGFLKGLK